MIKKSINLVMPMGGSGSRFSQNGFSVPKPIIEISGKPFFYWATQSIRKYVNLESLTFVILQEHIDKFSIDKKIYSFFPEARIEVIQEVLNGAVLTCLEGIKSIKNDLPIVFNDCDHAFSCKEFYKYCIDGEYSELDGALLTFESNDPKFSFAECNSEGNVIRTVEKVAISNEAICGAYYFKNRKTFEEATNEYLDKCNYKEYFVSGVYNMMAEKDKVIHCFRVDSHLPFGTPEEYEIAEQSDYFKELD